MIDQPSVTARAEATLLSILNAGQLAADDLASVVRDDPLRGSPEGRGLSRELARRVPAYRQTLPRGRFERLKQLKEVKGLGEDTYHDVLTSFAALPAADQLATAEHDR